jgi:hypothetical protein
MSPAWGRGGRSDYPTADEVATAVTVVVVGFSITVASTIVLAVRGTGNAWFWILIVGAYTAGLLSLAASISLISRRGRIKRDARGLAEYGARRDRRLTEAAEKRLAQALENEDFESAAALVRALDHDRLQS